MLSSQYCKEQAPFGPVVFYGIQWMGELTAAVQVFGKDPVTGEVFARTPKTVSDTLYSSCFLQLTSVYCRDKTFFGHPQPVVGADPYPNLKTKFPTARTPRGMLTILTWL